MDADALQITHISQANAPCRPMGKQRLLCIPLQRCIAHSCPHHPSRATRGACTSHVFSEMRSPTTLSKAEPLTLNTINARAEPPGGRRDVGKRRRQETLRRPCARVRDIPSPRFSAVNGAELKPNSIYCRLQGTHRYYE